MLASPEGVRDYLAQKQRLVKAELQLRQSESVVATAAAQTASDREVICFLDRRVREPRRHRRAGGNAGGRALSGLQHAPG